MECDRAATAGGLCLFLGRRGGLCLLGCSRGAVLGEARCTWDFSTLFALRTDLSLLLTSLSDFLSLSFFPPDAII